MMLRLNVSHRVDLAALTLFAVVGLAAALTVLEAGPAFAQEDAYVDPEPQASEGDILTPRVALANFTTEISNREPVDTISFLSSAKRVVHFFTDLRNLEGREIRHVWSYEGQDMGIVTFRVKGPRWRVWSTKQLLEAWLGQWTVSVLNEEDEVLATESFTYQAAAP